MQHHHAHFVADARITAPNGYISHAHHPTTPNPACQASNPSHVTTKNGIPRMSAGVLYEPTLIDLLTQSNCPCCVLPQIRYLGTSRRPERCSREEYQAAVISLYVTLIVALAIEVALICISLRGVVWSIP